MNIAPSLFSTAMGKGTSDKCVALLLFLILHRFCALSRN